MCTFKDKFSFVINVIEGKITGIHGLLQHMYLNHVQLYYHHVADNFTFLVFFTIYSIQYNKNDKNTSFHCPRVTNEE